jgi:hypothetical protein
MNQWAVHELWEGCLTVNLPGQWTDCRSLRDLPQNQEVFLAPNQGKDSFSVDMLELLADEDTTESAARAHWNELSDLNQEPVCEKDLFVRLVKRNDGKSVPVVAGMQGSVRVWIALFRLPKQATDMLLCWNQVDSLQSLDKDFETFQQMVMSLVINKTDFLG